MWWWFTIHVACGTCYWHDEHDNETERIDKEKMNEKWDWWEELIERSGESLIIGRWYHIKTQAKQTKALKWTRISGIQASHYSSYQLLQEKVVTDIASNCK